MAEMRLSELCKRLTEYGFPARLEGADRTVCAVNTLEDATPQELSFLSNPKYAQALTRTKAGAVVLDNEVVPPNGVSVVRSGDPYAAMTVSIILLHGYRRHPQWGVSERASIERSATIGKNANIAAGATIGANAKIGDNCTIYPGCYVADGAQLGSDCTLFPNVVIYDHCALGNRVTVHAGSIIGQDGLGYAPHNEKWVKIPQVGRVIVGDDVEIGANCAIDRATLGRTEIGSGTKFGNVIVIGHGTKVGPDCMFVGLIGLAGSVTVGRHVTLAGQVGAAGHITIGDNASVGAQAGISGDVPPGAKFLGSPAIPHEKAKRSVYAMEKLPEWTKRIKDLEREVAVLRKMLEDRA
jgi:UDP-3-O-[3-hydroxymyristoyl] glucosamine N-acyltransferase